MNYQMYDRPAVPGEGRAVSIDRILSCGNFPADIFDNPKAYFADFFLDPEGGKEVCEALKEVQGNPDAKITIYRGAPAPELNYGDWVSLSKGFVARRYARPYSENPRNRLYSFTARASEISFGGKSLFENGYFGAVKTLQPALNRAQIYSHRGKKWRKDMNIKDKQGNPITPGAFYIAQRTIGSIRAGYAVKVKEIDNDRICVSVGSYGLTKAQFDEQFTEPAERLIYWKGKAYELKDSSAYAVLMVDKSTGKEVMLTQGQFSTEAYGYAA